MSGVSSVTSQLNNTNACNSCDCNGLTARLQAVESVNSQQENHLRHLDDQVDPLDGLINGIRGALGLKEDRGQLAELDQVAHRALDLATAHEAEIANIESDIGLIQRLLAAIAREAENAMAMAKRAYDLAQATSNVTQHHTRQIEDLEIEVRSLQDRMSRLESQKNNNDLEPRVKSLEDWRTGTVAAIAFLEYQILQLKNQKGIKGDKGDKGDHGLPGKDGKNGTKGEKGDKGLSGKDGKPGKDGKAGTNGKNGATGQPGLNGTAGDDGKPGSNGKPGTNGTPGYSGTNGTPGSNGKPGNNGTPGTNGTPGKDGNPGTNGKPGTNGNPGTNGTPGKDAKVEFSNISVKTFDHCDPKTAAPIFINTSVSVIKGTELSETLKFLELANLEAQQCIECPPAILASPEWWELRPGNNRPQLLLLFSPEDSNRANYQITIPHWQGDKPDPKYPPIKEYIKGSYMAVVHLADSSKLIVNVKDQNEAKFVLGKLKPTIDKGQVAGGRTNYTVLGGVDIKVQTMTCRYAAYYPFGQKSKKPQWVVKFDVE